MKDILDKKPHKKEILINANKNLKSGIASILKKLMNIANISESELSRRTNIKQPIIHRLLSGDNKNPKLMTIKPIADYFMLTVSQLIGEDEIDPTWKGFTLKDHSGWIKVPLKNWHQCIVHNKQKLPKFIITECTVGEEAFAVYIFDQSMEPIFPEKSIVIADPTKEPKNENYIIVQNHQDELLIRNYLIISQEKFINPINNKFGTIAKLSAKDKILGTVIRTIYDHNY